jgi:hypothetical protein
MTINKKFKSIGKFFLLACLIALPLFFLPITRDFYDTNKWMLFVLTSLVVLLAWSIRLIFTRCSSFSWSPAVLGMGLITATGFFSLTFSSFNKIEALLNPFGPITWIAATIILFFGPSIFSQKEKTILRLGIAALAGLAGLLVLYQQLGLGTMFFGIGSPFANPFFTPVGSTIGLLTFLCLCLPISIAIAIGAVKEHKEMIAAVSVVTAFLTFLGIGITLFKYIPLASSQMLHIPLGMHLMVQSWNSIPHILFGVGPERFFEIFTLYRPQPTNMSPIWNIGFHANASLVLHIGSTMGILGLISFGAFSVLLWKEWSAHPVSNIQAILFILLALFAPPTFVLVLLVTLLLLSSDTNADISIPIHGVTKYVIVLFTFSLSLVSFYGLLRWHSGERLLFQSVTSAEKGNGSETFMLIERALKTNPTNPAFHSTMSQTALLLAESLMGSAPVDKNGAPNLGDDDKTLLTNLVGRSIQEAKLAITLSPTTVSTWVNIAGVYQGLIGIAKDADVWAIAAYQKAITLDPTNPVLHLNLGGLYMSLNRQEDAGKEFIIAINLKPNYIDGFYNLANAFRQKGDWDNAVKALEQTKLLIAKGSTDEGKIEQEIIAIRQEKKEKGTSNQPTSLYVPELKMPE